MNKTANMQELIRSRRSVRTFDGKLLAPEDGQRMLDFARQAENPYGLPIEWRLLDAESQGLSSPVINGGRVYIAGKMQAQPQAEEAFGYSFERVVLFAQSLGIGTTWIAGTMNRGAFEKAMDLKEGEVLPCVSPLGYPALKMSLRETLMRKGVRADSRLAFEELFFEGSFDTPLKEDTAGKLAPVLEAVRWAPSAVNKQPWRLLLAGDRVHFYEKQGKGYVSEKGWDIQKIDMGIALCHFELTARALGMAPSFVREDPCLPGAEALIYIASYKLQQS